MINIEIENSFISYSQEPIDPFNELDPITFGLRRFMRENNHQVKLTQGNLTRNLKFDPDMILFVEAFPEDFFEALTSNETTIDIANWPILLFIQKREDLFNCRFDFAETSDLLKENELKALLLGTAEKIANMAKEKGYLTDEQVKQFLTGKW